MKYTQITAIILGLTISGSAFAFAQVGAGKSAYAPGQAKAIANCGETIATQNANGQTDTETGNNDHDAKPGDTFISPTAVTNCDHFFGNNAP